MTKKFISSAAFAALTPLIFCTAAQADLSYTLAAHVSGPNAVSLPDLKANFSFQNGFERTDAVISTGDRSVDIVTVTDCAAGKVYTFDPTLKLYTVSDIASQRPGVLGIGTQMATFGGASGTQLILPLPIAISAGETGTNVDVIDRGPERIGKTNTHHSTLILTATGEAVAPQQTVDIWTDDNVPQPLDCGVTKALGGGAAYPITGSVDKLRSILGSAPARIAYKTAGGMTVTYDRTSLSTRSIDSRQFSMPADARQVTSTEFADAERHSIGERLRRLASPGSDRAAPVTPLGPNQSNGIDNPGANPIPHLPGS